MGDLNGDRKAIILNSCDYIWLTSYLLRSDVMADVEDYYNIDLALPAMADFERLAAEAAAGGSGLIKLDMA